MKHKRPVQTPIETSYTDSQIKIILAAETLFAKASIDSVSMREIAAKAEQRNHYAVQYHFGSLDGLVNAVFTYRMLQMEPRRRAMLEAAERNEKLHHARTLLDMVFLPQLELHDADGNHSYANFLVQFLLRRRFQQFGEFGVPSPPCLDQILKLLRIRLGYLPNAVAQRRLISAALVFLNILVTYGDEPDPASEGESFDSALDDTMQQIENSIFMPWSPKGHSVK